MSAPTNIIKSLSSKKRHINLAAAVTLFSLISIASFGQSDTAVVNDIKRFQTELVNEYSNPETSPLKGESKKEFEGIHFFDADENYIVKAKFLRTPAEKVFSMKTSGGITKSYVKYGEALFKIKDKEYKLNVYQSIGLTKSPKYRDYLFIPFRDATSGKETYGGGRYIDLAIPATDSIVINFNKAYQPYCAYTEGYNCPIPPRENTLPVKIEAGVRY